MRMMSIFGQILPIRIAAGLLGAAAVGLLSASPLLAEFPGAKPIDFKVFRDGQPLGHHKVSFRRMGEELHVEIDIELEVKIAFVTLFRYSHQNREVWRDGRLVAIDTKTDDDGEAYWLSGRATDAGLEIEGSSGRVLAPADIMPTSYWNPGTIGQSRLLDTQKGRLIDVEIAPVGPEKITMAGERIEAQRYKVDGDLTLDLWYTPDGDWAKTKFSARGADVIYNRKAGTTELAGNEASTEPQ